MVAGGSCQSGSKAAFSIDPHMAARGEGMMGMTGMEPGASPIFLLENLNKIELQQTAIFLPTFDWGEGGVLNLCNGCDL